MNEQCESMAGNFNNSRLNIFDKYSIWNYYETQGQAELAGIVLCLFRSPGSQLLFSG